MFPDKDHMNKYVINMLYTISPFIHHTGNVRRAQGIMGKSIISAFITFINHQNPVTALFLTFCDILSNTVSSTDTNAGLSGLYFVV